MTGGVGSSVFLPAEVVFGVDTIGDIGKHAASFGRRTLLVTHRPGRFTSSGVPERLRDCLSSAGIEFEAFETPTEPDTTLFDSGAEKAREFACDSVIGLGGGSALDLAKGVALLAVHEGSVEDYQLGRRSLERAPLPVIAIPTTAGTGSEVSRVAVVTNSRLGIKKSISDQRLIPRVAILDPATTVHCDRKVTGAVGLDALSHAFEARVSTGRTAFTDAVSVEAARRLALGLPRAVENGDDVQARSDALYGACLAGMALNAGVGAAHVLAQPISAVTGLSHSSVISILLPHVIGANDDHDAGGYAALAEAMFSTPSSGSRPAERLISFVRSIATAAGVPGRFRDTGVTETQLLESVTVALRWQGHIRTNPREVDRGLLESIVVASY